jgi:hypothetical protein
METLSLVLEEQKDQGLACVVDHNCVQRGSEQLDSVREDAPDQITVVMRTGFVASAQRARIAKKGMAPREECETASDWAFQNNVHFEG